MVVECLTNIPTNPIINMCDDTRLNVLYSPFRRRELNPQDWESKMSFWKINIRNWCQNYNTCIISVCNLQSIFTRNGRHALCLTTVFGEMLRNNEIIPLQEFLSKSPPGQTWSTWAVNCLVKAPIVWSFRKLKDSLIAKPEVNIDELYVHLAVLKDQSESLMMMCKSKNGKVINLDEIKSLLKTEDEQNVRVILHWLQLQGLAAVTDINNKVIVKLGSGSEHAQVTSFTEADIGLYWLHQNESKLMRMVEQLEREKQDIELEVREYLKKGMRHVAKSCLRKKKELEKCTKKRISALENVQVLLSRVKEAESDGEILESYKMGLAALKATFKDAGLSEDSVSQTMDQVHEVLEVHEEIQSALSEPIAESFDLDLEKELAELLAEDKLKPDLNAQTPTLNKLPDLPEPPSQSPTNSPAVPTKAKVALM